MTEPLKIREYEAGDQFATIELFQNTVRTINARDYPPLQIEAWLSTNRDFERWNLSFSGHYALVAYLDDQLVGFGDISQTGYLDRLYVHADYQNAGIGTALCDRLEKAVSSTITTAASISARDFFARRGYRICRRQEVERGGVRLINYLMEKKTRF